MAYVWSVWSTFDNSVRTSERHRSHWVTWWVSRIDQEESRVVLTSFSSVSWFFYWNQGLPRSRYFPQGFVLYESTIQIRSCLFFLRLLICFVGINIYQDADPFMELFFCVRTGPIFSCASLFAMPNFFALVSNNTLAVCGFASHPFSDQFLERCFSSCFLGFEGGAAACQGAAPVERQWLASFFSAGLSPCWPEHGGKPMAASMG